MRGWRGEEWRGHGGLRSGLLAHLGGYAPAISIEYARKILPTELRPGFTEVEEATAALPPA